ncbi:hypothetical protein C8R46DRAFT_1319671 [Mycena filopes]|nr:hypothetical protein C8R46DRAFT_1319671 [Mycena filopes]
MPHPRTTIELRVEHITAYLTPALTLLDSLNDAFGLPYIQLIIKTTQALIMGVTDPMLEARLNLAAAQPSLRSGPGIQTLQLLEKALALLIVLSNSTGDDSSTQCHCLIDIAWFKWRSGDYAAALALGRHTKQLAYQATNLFAASTALNMCTTSLTSLGDYPNAMMEINKGKELTSLCGMTSSHVHHNFLNLEAEIHLCKSEYTEARQIYATNLQESGLDPSAESYVIALLSIAQIDIIIGTRKELVRGTLETAYKTSVNTHLLRGQTWRDLLSGHLDLREGNPASAKAAFQDCLISEDSDAVIYSLEQLADVAQWPTKFADEGKWPVLYLGQAHKTKDKLGLSKALLFTADLFIEDDEITSQSLLTVALEGFTFMDVHRSRAQCMMRLGDLAQKKKTPEAVELWKSARPLFERSLQAKDVARIDDRLGAIEQESLAKLTTLHAPMALAVANSS